MAPSPRAGGHRRAVPGPSLTARTWCPLVWSSHQSPPVPTPALPGGWTQVQAARGQPQQVHSHGGHSPRTGHGREPSQSRHPRPQPCQRAAGAPCQALWTVCQVTYGTDLARAAGTRRPAAPSTQIGAVSANALSRRERSARQLSKHLQRGSCTGTE